MLKKIIEGEYKEGDIALVIDDVSTTGSSIARAVEALKSNNLIVYDAFVIVDREEGAREKLQQLNIELHYLITLREILSLISQQASIPYTKEIRGNRHE
jgi:orotate phosphoribosyltransferase